MENRVDDIEQMSLFDQTNEDESIANNGAKLNVVKADFVHAELLTWEELFDGFDSIKAITYSSGIDFVYELLKKFRNAEVIFGCEEVLSGAAKDLLAYQVTLVNALKKRSKNIRDLCSRIDDESVRFWVSRQQLSHEKIYILSSVAGRTRVITGSANMSYNAFGGKQREDIFYFDGQEAFDYYSSIFEDLKCESTDKLVSKVFMIEDLEAHLDQLPIAETVRDKKVLIVEKDLSNQDVKFVLDTKNLSSKLGPMIPKETEQKGKIRIVPDTFKTISRKWKDERIQREDSLSQYPSLIVDVEKGEVTLNDKEYDIHPDKELVKKDVGLFLDYMNGYSSFHGDSEGLKTGYYEFANWFFCSPFMGVMRDMALRYDVTTLPYPIFGILYGQSKAGKTTFLETLLKMMIGQKPTLMAEDFTRKNISQLKRTVNGVPIIVDDITQLRFNQHAIETIKNDQFGFSEHYIHYPAVIVSANEDVKAVAPEVIRRTVRCRVQAGLTNTEVMQSSIVKKVQRNIGTALYGEYLSRMIPLVSEMLEDLKDDSAEAPDILKTSSMVIKSILEEYCDVLPEFVHDVSLDSYFNEKTTGKYAIKAIQKAWEMSRRSFIVSEKTNELKYNAGQTYEADRIIKELPENLEAHKSREWVIMNLDEARSFFEMQFKKKWWLFGN